MIVPNILIPSTEWVDFYETTGLTRGAAFQINNLSNQANIVFRTDAEKPAADVRTGWNVGPGNTAGGNQIFPSGLDVLWVRSTAENKSMQVYANFFTGTGSSGDLSDFIRITSLNGLNYPV